MRREIRRETRSGFTWLAAAIWLFVLAGCAGWLSLEKPQVTLADIQVLEIRTMETAFLVQLRITNPNDRPLDIQGLSCDMELDGRRFASGLQGGGETIPPYGSVLVPVEVHASVLDMVSSVLGLLQHAEQPGAPGRIIKYRLIGKVRVTTSGLSRNLPFESTGRLKL